MIRFKFLKLLKLLKVNALNFSFIKQNCHKLTRLNRLAHDYLIYTNEKIKAIPLLQDHCPSGWRFYCLPGALNYGVKLQEKIALFVLSLKWSIIDCNLLFVVSE